MRIILSFVLVISTLTVPSVILAEDRPVEIDWSLPTAIASEIQSYVLSYSQNSDMLGASVQTCEQPLETGTEGDQTSYTMRCPAVPVILGQIAYFTIEGTASDGTAYVSGIISKDYNIAVVSDFQIVGSTSSPIITDTPKFELAVNFQPANSDVPTNFVVDSGSIFDVDRGYGWVSAVVDLRDRDLSLSLDQSYDTHIMPKSTNEWNVAVAPGNYTVTICVGDPFYPRSTNVISIEGIQVMNETVNYDTRWVTKSATVAVTDDLMTFTFIGSSVAPDYLQICWIKIEQQ